MATQSLSAMKQTQQAGTNVAAVDPIKLRVALLDKGKSALGAGASESIKVEREIRAAGLMIANSKDLQEADPRTIYTSVSNAINSGIGLCNGRGYLVAYKGKASFVPGWKGLIDLVARTGRATAWTGVVYQGDRFDYELGGDPYLRHKPEGDADDWKQATHVYAIGRIKGSDFPIIEVWTINKVIKHLNKFNKVGGRHYALKDDNNMEMYARKVVLMQAIKYLPSSQDLDNAIAADFAAENNREVVIDGNFVHVDDFNADAGQPAATAEAAPQRRPQPDAAQQPEAPAQPDDLLAGRQQPADERSDYDKLKNRLETLRDPDMLDVEADLINDLNLTDAERDALKSIYRARRDELTGSAQQQPQRATARPRGGMNIE